MTQTLFAVGVGPGDPELVTLKGARLIRSADVVVTPVSDTSDASVALQIVEGMLEPARQRIVTQVYPMKRPGPELEEFWRRSAAEVTGYLEQGQRVVFITLGDPSLYSTFLYLYRELQSHHPEVRVEVVPGVTSFNAAAGQALSPLVLGDERLAILPATYENERLERVFEDFDTVVLMKVHRVFSRIRNLLEDRGLGDNVVFARRVGMDGEVIHRRLDAVQPDDLDYLSLLIVRRAREDA